MWLKNYRPRSLMINLSKVYQTEYCIVGDNPGHYRLYNQILLQKLTHKSKYFIPEDDCVTFFVFKLL